MKTDAQKRAGLKWQKGNPDKAREYQRRYRAKHPEVMRVRNRMRSRKRRGGLPTALYPCTDACECCGRPAWLETRELALDHDHETGAFRGWLCWLCNTGIGQLGDNIAGVEKALAYLTRRKP